MSGCPGCLPIMIGPAEAASNVTITAVGSVLAVNLTEITRLTIEDIDAPILVEGWVTVQNTATGSPTNADVYLGIAPVDPDGTTAALSMLESTGEINIGNGTTEPPGRKMRVAVILDPSSPGEYMLGAFRETGSDAAQVTVNQFLHAVLYGLRGG
jgi:hypothetical protein